MVSICDDEKWSSCKIISNAAGIRIANKPYPSVQVLLHKIHTKRNLVTFVASCAEKHNVEQDFAFRARLHVGSCNKIAD